MGLLDTSIWGGSPLISAQQREREELRARYAHGEILTIDELAKIGMVQTSLPVSAPSTTTPPASAPFNTTTAPASAPWNARQTRGTSPGNAFPASLVLLPAAGVVVLVLWFLFRKRRK
jgi:hypothetical protein